MENCSCKDISQKDGCYHCLYAYRQSQQIGNISSGNVSTGVKLGRRGCVQYRSRPFACVSYGIPFRIRGYYCGLGEAFRDGIFLAGIQYKAGSAGYFSLSPKSSNPKATARRACFFCFSASAFLTIRFASSSEIYFAFCSLVVSKGSVLLPRSFK